MTCVSENVPLPVRFVGMLCVLFGFVGMIAVVFALINVNDDGGSALSVFEQFPGLSGATGRTLIVSMVFVVVLSGLVVGIGILRCRDWARLIFLAFAAVNMISALTVLYAGVFLRGVIALLVWGYLMFYFTRPHIRKLYRA